MADQTEQWLQLIPLIQNGFSASEACHRLGVLCSLAIRWVHSFLSVGKVRRCLGSVDPHISARREDQTLHKGYLKGPFRSASQQKAVSVFPGCSQMAINRLQTEYNIRCYRAVTKETMTRAHAGNRHAFVTGLFDGFDWKKLIFTNVITVSTDYSRPVGVYPEPGHMYDLQYMNRCDRLGLISVACWGRMSWDRAGVLKRIYCRLDLAQYLHILKNVFFPTALEHYPKKPIMFQQDNFSACTVMVIQVWFCWEVQG